MRDPTVATVATAQAIQSAGPVPIDAAASGPRIARYVVRLTAPIKATRDSSARKVL